MESDETLNSLCNRHVWMSMRPTARHVRVFRTTYVCFKVFQPLDIDTGLNSRQICSKCHSHHLGHVSLFSEGQCSANAIHIIGPYQVRWKASFVISRTLQNLNRTENPLWPDDTKMATYTFGHIWNDDVVGAAPTGDAPTTPERSTI